MSQSTAEKAEREVERAESKLDRSTGEFEVAMNHLESKMEHTMGKVKSAVDAVKRPKQKLVSSITSARGHAARYGSQTKDFVNKQMLKGKLRSQEMMGKVKENPKPVMMGALAMAGTALLAVLMDRRMSRKKTVIYQVHQEPVRHETDAKVSKVS